MLVRSFIRLREALGSSVVIVGDTLKLFESSDSLFNQRYCSLLQGDHVLLFHSVLLHVFSFGSLSDELTHMFINNEDFVDSSTSEITGTVALAAADSFSCIGNIVTYKLDLSFGKRLDTRTIRAYLTHKSLRDDSY